MLRGSSTVMYRTVAADAVHQHGLTGGSPTPGDVTGYLHTQPYRPRGAGLAAMPAMDNPRNHAGTWLTEDVSDPTWNAPTP
jgi:hypothetical protein